MHRLSLRENALDSLSEAVRKLVQAREGDDGAYKFAVLHCSHFLELLLKYAVARLHPLLLQRHPGSDKRNGETIGIWEAVRILERSGTPIDGLLKNDLGWFKELRNDIEHYEFELSPAEVRVAIGRLVRAAEELSTSFGMPALGPEVAADCREHFETLLDEERERVTNARLDALKEDRPDGVDWCQYCGLKGTIVWRADTIYCHACKETEQIHLCCQCDSPTPERWCMVWNDDHPPTIDYICEFCHDRIVGLH